MPAAATRPAPFRLVLLAAAGLASCAPPGTLAPVEEGAPASIHAGARAYRWSPAASQPLRLYVQQRSDLPGFTPEHRALVDRAVRAWTASGVVDVARTGWEGGANIRVRWTSGLPAKHPGLTMLKLDRRGELVQADIWVNVVPAPIPGASPEAVLYAVIAHEVGHALGMPHVAQREDLMHPVLGTYSVTRADLEALRAIAVTGSLPSGHGAASSSALSASALSAGGPR